MDHEGWNDSGDGSDNNGHQDVGDEIRLRECDVQSDVTGDIAIEQRLQPFGQCNRKGETDSHENHGFEDIASEDPAPGLSKRGAYRHLFRPFVG